MARKRQLEWPETANQNGPKLPIRMARNCQSEWPETANQNGPKLPSQNSPKTPNQNGPNVPNQNGPKTPNRNGPKTPNQNVPKVPNQNGPKTPNQKGPKVPNKCKNKIVKKCQPQVTQTCHKNNKGAFVNCWSYTPANYSCIPTHTSTQGRCTCVCSKVFCQWLGNSNIWWSSLKASSHIPNFNTILAMILKTFEVRTGLRLLRLLYTSFTTTNLTTRNCRTPSYSNLSVHGGKWASIKHKL